MRRTEKRLIFLALLAALPGPARAGKPEPKLPADSLPVPIMRQATTYSCGAAALNAILYYWQVWDGSEGALYELLETTPEQGTHPVRIAEGARTFGLQSRWKEGTTLSELKTALEAGETVILDIQAWRSEENRGRSWKDLWEDGHYVVAVGLDEHYLYAMDPSGGARYTFMPLDELMDRWHDYEDRAGKVWRNQQLAIFIKGETPIARYPAPLLRLE